MPELSRFLGIVIYMLYDDHRPAHFHADYGEYRISVEVESGVLEGHCSAPRHGGADGMVSLAQG